MPLINMLMITITKTGSDFCPEDLSGLKICMSCGTGCESLLFVLIEKKVFAGG